MDYFHIFDDQPQPITLTNANVTAAGWSKVVLPNRVDTAHTGTCATISFFALVSGKGEVLQKVLTEPACTGGRGILIDRRTILNLTANVTVDEPIAPMGTSGGFSAHLHLQLNNGNDNILSVMNVNQDLIPGKGRFAFSLNQTAFTSDSVKAMTNGPGFALKVTENSLVPVLDKLEVKVPLSDGSWKTTLFSFGGKIDEDGNVTDAMVQSDLNFATGSTAKTVKPVGWGESGKAREMWFFVPHQAADFSGLKAGTTYKLKVTATTVYGASYPADVAFTYTPGCDVPVLYGGREWQRCGSQAMMDWNQANNYCASLTDGGYGDWILPGIDDLQSLVFCSNGTQVKKCRIRMAVVPDISADSLHVFILDKVQIGSEVRITTQGVSCYASEILLPMHATSELPSRTGIPCQVKGKKRCARPWISAVRCPVASPWRGSGQVVGKHIKVDWVRFCK